MADSFAPPGLLWQRWEHAQQMGVGVADPFAFGGDAEQVLGDDQAEQLNVAENRFAAWVVITRKAERGQYPVVEMDVKCGQEGVEVGFHTQGLTPSVND